jgi:hypothetical protein
MRRLKFFAIGLLTLAIASSIPTTGLAQDTSQNASQAPETPSIEDILTILEREEPPRGSRGELCAISPGLLGETDVIWSDRPVFVWHGEAIQLTVRSFGNDQPPLLQQPLTSTTRSIVYSGSSLLPGQLYVWELSTRAAPGPWFTFEVMAGESRDRIAQDLQTLDDQLNARGASEEAIALARAQYFAEQRLWSDVFQALQAVPRPSADLTQGITEMANYLCGEE